VISRPAWSASLAYTTLFRSGKSEGALRAPSEAEVVHREHVGARKRGDEKHLRRPAADSAHRSELCDQRLVVDRLALRSRRHYALDRKSTRLNSSHVKISYAV